MASGIPIVRQISWVRALPSLLVMMAAVILGWYVGGETGPIVAIVCFLVYSITVRWLVCRDHRAGIRLVRAGRFAEAIGCFERSLDFFERHPWLDDWRGLVLLSSSMASYREMALLNSAYCHGQLGEGSLAVAMYRRCLEQFPGSRMAESALRMLESVRPESTRGVTLGGSG